jgi:2-methylfumaryl-CoA hydratase
MVKASRGNFFEDFKHGMLMRHPVPRTLTEGDQALYIGLTGDRRPLHCSATFARACGLPRETIADMLVFNVVFGKSVGDISLNAVANLGYADVRFLRPVFAGDTIRAESEVIGLRETSNGKSGIVWVRTRGLNQREEEVIRFCRWVMVEKREPSRFMGMSDDVELPPQVPAAEMWVPPGMSLRGYRELRWATGGRAMWDDFEMGEKILHPEAMTIEESDHMMATRLYQNNAKVHFNAHQMQSSRFGKRLVYGGHVISLAHALAFNGFENALAILAWNGGSHTNPCFGGDTIYAFSEVVERAEIAHRDDAGALRVRLSAVKNMDPSREAFAHPEKGSEGPDPRLVLVLDYWLLLPRR